MTSKTEKELAEVTEVTQQEEQSEQDYFKAVIRAAGSVSDDKWGSLSEAAQLWVNVGVYCNDTKQEIPTFDDSDRIKELKSEMDTADAEAKETKDAKASKQEDQKVAKKAKAKAAPKAKAAAPKAKAKGGKKAAADGAGRGRKGSFPPEAKISLKVKENPHRKGTNDFNKFKNLTTGMSVQKAVDAGVDWGYLRYGVGREFFSIK